MRMRTYVYFTLFTVRNIFEKVKRRHLKKENKNLGPRDPEGSGETVLRGGLEKSDSVLSL